MLSEIHPMTVHVCTRKESEKWLSYIVHCVTLEETPCNISAHLNLEEQQEAACLMNKTVVFKMSFSQRSLFFHSVFYEVFLKLLLHWSSGDMSWFLMHHIYLIYYISNLSLTLQKMKMCVFFGSCQSVLSAVLTTLYHQCCLIIKCLVFFFYLNLWVQSKIRKIQIVQDSYFKFRKHCR